MTLTGFMQNKTLFENKKRTRDEYEEHVSDSLADEDSHPQP